MGNAAPAVPIDPPSGVLVPAAVGTYLLSPCLDEAGTLMSFAKSSILSWCVSQRATTPVTIHGVDPYARAVLMPDGHVEDFVVGSWDSLEDYTADMLEQDCEVDGSSLQLGREA